MKIIMMVSERGSIDGIRSAMYVAGSEYNLSDSPGAVALAEAFIGAGMAEEVHSRTIETKVTDPDLEVGQLVELAFESKPGAKPGRKK
jgi:hypothetical protein